MGDIVSIAKRGTISLPVLYGTRKDGAVDQGRLGYITCSSSQTFFIENILRNRICNPLNRAESSSFECVCVCVCFLPIYTGHQVRWTYQPGSYRRKVTQDFSSTFLLRYVP